MLGASLGADVVAVGVSWRWRAFYLCEFLISFCRRFSVPFQRDKTLMSFSLATLSLSFYLFFHFTFFVTARVKCESKKEFKALLLYHDTIIDRMCHKLLPLTILFFLFDFFLVRRFHRTVDTKSFVGKSIWSSRMFFPLPFLRFLWLLL